MRVPVTPFGGPADDAQLGAFSNGVKAESGVGPAKSPGSPRWNDIAHVLPPRSTSTSSRSDRALTTDAPTPCSPPGRGVRSAAELAAGVQLGEHDLDAAEPGARLDVDRDAARAVAHLDAAVGVQDDLDARAVAAEGLVDGVVDDLPEAVHEPAGVGRADVHAGALADRFEPLQHLEMMGGVLGGHNPQGYPRAC